MLELGSNMGRALRGYTGRVRASFSNGSGFEFIAIDKQEERKPDYLRHRIRLGLHAFFHNKPKAEANFRQGMLPAALWNIKNCSIDHLHMHMLTGGFSEGTLEEFVCDIARIMKQGGVFFISFDHELFSQWEIGNNEGKVIAVFEDMLKPSFRLVFRSFIRNPPYDPSGNGSAFFLSQGQKLERIMLPEAIALSTNFGARISASRPHPFFKRFSDCAEGWCYYFAIAIKE